MDYFTELGYLGLFLASFLAATILPLSSEVVLVVLLHNEMNPVMLVSIATFGNVLGSLVNYAIGAWGSVFVVRKVLKVSEAQFDRSKQRFKRFGVFSLLFAWVPLIGDPLTLVAGVLRINLWVFLILVTAGKLMRYLAVSYVAIV